MTGWVGANRRVLAVEDVHDDPRFNWVPNLDDDRFISMLSVPILLKERLLGVLNVQTEAHRTFSSQEIDFFAAIAAQLAGIIEITGLKRELNLSQALRASQESYQHIVETAWEGIWTFDAHDRTKYANQRLCDMLGYSADELYGRSFQDFALDVTADEVRRRTEERRRGISEQYDAHFLRKDGSDLWAIVSANPVFDAEGNFVEWLAMLTDVTERKRAEDALKFQALHDALTNLPNRTLLEDRLAQALRTARRLDTPLGLLLLDLDRFKEVNDTLGHPVGDVLLRQVGPRLRNVLRESDTVSRMGGDEFAVLLPGAGTVDAAVIAAKIIEAIEQPFIVEGQPLHVGASLGLVIFPEHGDDAETLLRRADLAMYVAKRDGGGYALFVSDQDQESGVRLLLAADLRQAIGTNELELFYQPKVNIATGKVTSVEALLRWHHPTRGLLSPTVFIPLAEQTGLIAPLSQWVLEAAVRQSRAWRDMGVALSVAVNLSMRNLQDAQLPEQIAGLLALFEVHPDWLKLEITESMIMADPERTIGVLARINAMGVQLSIDDFGTGYSSLAHLARLPVSEIKIDKSFVTDMEANASNAVIVRSTIDLAHNLGLSVVAEGVERQEVWSQLSHLGCDLAQGYLMARPLPATDFELWLGGR